MNIYDCLNLIFVILIVLIITNASWETPYTRDKTFPSTKSFCCFLRSRYPALALRFDTADLQNSLGCAKECVLHQSCARVVDKCSRFDGVPGCCRTAILVYKSKLKLSNNCVYNEVTAECRPVQSGLHYV